MINYATTPCKDRVKGECEKLLLLTAALVSRTRGNPLLETLIISLRKCYMQAALIITLKLSLPSLRAASLLFINTRADAFINMYLLCDICNMIIRTFISFTAELLFKY